MGQAAGDNAAEGRWLADNQRDRAFLDPRTKLFLLVTLPTFLMGGAGGPEMAPFLFIFPLLPFVLLVISGNFRIAAMGIVLLNGTRLLWFFAAPHLRGGLYILFYIFYGVILELCPCALMGIYAIKTTKVSEFISGMERLRIPQLITIPTSVMFRFFPTVGEEAAAINDAMQMRGIHLGRNGLSRMVEYRLIPIIMCSLRIGDELSAAALTRGLGAPVKRTSICRIGLQAQDILFMLLCAAAFAAWLLGAFGVYLW
jgi:energy-coupling factor transport system permease protein